MTYDATLGVAEDDRHASAFRGKVEYVQELICLLRANHIDFYTRRFPSETRKRKKERKKEG